MHRDGVSVVAVVADVCEDLAAVAEGGVEHAIGVVARDAQVDIVAIGAAPATRILPSGCTARALAVASPAPMAVMTLPVPEPNVVSRSPGAAWVVNEAQSASAAKHSAEQMSHENSPIEFLTRTRLCPVAQTQIARRLFWDCDHGGLILGACRALGVESENRPQRGQFCRLCSAHTGVMGPKGGEWDRCGRFAADEPKSDRLRRRDGCVNEASCCRLGVLWQWFFRVNDSRAVVTGRFITISTLR